jgi:uncharacterized protein YifN (PemK superfamily)
MAVKYDPHPGTILLCDFSGNIPPEINKKRPIVVLSTVSAELSIVVPLSTTRPLKQQKWHYLLQTPQPLPAPYDGLEHWVKGDMIYTVSFKRLSYPIEGKAADGKRLRVVKIITAEDLAHIYACISAAIFG